MKLIAIIMVVLVVIVMMMLIMIILITIVVMQPLKDGGACNTLRTFSSTSK